MSKKMSSARRVEMLREFEQRRREAEAQCAQAESRFRRDVEHVQREGFLDILGAELREKIVPRQSLIGRFFYPTTRAAAPSDSYRTLTHAQSGEQSSSRGKHLVDTLLSVGKPLAVTVGLSIAKSILRKKFRFLRYVLR